MKDKTNKPNKKFVPEVSEKESSNFEKKEVDKTLYFACELCNSQKLYIIHFTPSTSKLLCWCEFCGGCTNFTCAFFGNLKRRDEIQKFEGGFGEVEDDSE